jgi:hypothetical protein
MTKRIMILLAICSLSLASLNGCTSKESKDDADIATDASSADATASGDGLDGLDNAGAPAAGADASAATGAAPAPAPGGTAEALPEESLDAGLDAQPNPSDTPAATPPADATAQATPPAAEPSMDLPPNEPTPEMAPMPEPTPSAGIAEVAPPEEKKSKPKYEPSAMEKEAAPKSSASLQKIPDKPWKEHGVLLNTVYFAHPGDTVSSISQMIYGANKTTELKKANPKLKSRDPKPSEKIFYNSPLRPQDADKMMTYYEDNGVQPETYVAKEGDTIQKVGKELLGYDQGWKEIWPVNAALESKGKLDPGTEIKFWKAGTTVAANTHPGTGMGTATPEATPPPPEMNAAPPPPPPPDMAANGAPPPPPPDMAPPPPPPPDMNAAPPPPPPPPQAEIKGKKPNAPAKGGAQGMDEDTMLALGVVAIAALGLVALLLSRRKRRQKELEAAFNETQVGT